MRFWERSVKVRLITYFLVLGLLPAIVVGSLAYKTGRDTVQAVTIQQLETAAALKEVEINRWIVEKRQLVRLLAQSPSIQGWSESLLTMDESDAAFTAAYDGLGQYLNDVLAESPNFLEISLLSDVGGKVILSTNKEREGDFYVTDLFFVKGREDTFVQNTYFSAALNRTTMTVATPVNAETGQRIGVVAVHLNLDSLNEIVLERSGLGETGETYLVDRLNVFVSQARGGQEEFPRGVHTEGIDQALSGNNGSGVYLNYAGDKVLGVYRWLEDQDMALLAEIGEDEALASINEFARTLFLAGTLVIILLAVSAYIFAGNISRPILAIAKTAAQVAEGDLTQRAPITTKDEVGRLARAFNSMTVQLQGFITGLEQRIADRTRALETSAEVSRRLSTILDLDQLTVTVVEQLKSAFNYYHAQIYLYDEARENLVMAGGTGAAGQTMLARGHKIPIGKGLVGRTAATHQAALVPDVAADPDWLPNPLLPDTKAEVTVPITLGKQVLGVLDVQHDAADGLDQSDVELLASIASQVAIGLHNAALFNQSEQDKVSLQEEKSHIQIILETITMPMVISNVSDGTVVYVNEPLSETIRMPRDDLMGQITPDFYADPSDRERFLALLREQGFAENYEVQLKRGDGDLFWALLSARVIQYQGQPAVLTSLIDIDDRKRAEVSLAKQANDLAAVAAVSTVAATILDPDELLQEAVDLTKSRFDLYHAHIHLLNEDQDALELTAGAGDVGRQMAAEGRHIPLSAEDSLVAAVARNKQGAIRNYDSAGKGFMPHPLLMETRSEMAVPIVLGDELLGVLDVRSDTLGNFGEADMQTFTTLATQIAAALQNARSFTRSEQAFRELKDLTRRLTREGWEGYLDTVSSDIDMVYDLEQGAVLKDWDESVVAETAVSALNKPLTVQGAAIGQIIVAAPQALTDEAAEIIDAVAERLSGHIENLRLTTQTEEALALTARLYDSGRRLNTAGDNLQEALAAVVDANPIPLVDRVVMFLFERDQRGNMQAIRAAANWDNGRPAMPPGAPGTVYTREAMAALDLLLSPKPVTFADIQNDEQIDPITVQVLKRLKIRSMAVIPLWVDERQLGCLLVETAEIYEFQPDEIEAYTAMAGQLAVAVDRNLLFNEAQSRAQREQILRQVSERVHAAVDAESVLRAAAQEISRTLGVEAFVYLDDNVGTPTTNGQKQGGSAGGKNS